MENGNQGVFKLKAQHTAKKKMDTLVAALGACIYKAGPRESDNFPLGEFFHAYLENKPEIWMTICGQLLIGDKFENRFVQNLVKSVGSKLASENSAEEDADEDDSDDSDEDEDDDDEEDHYYQ
jgi:hypothetical protein